MFDAIKLSVITATGALLAYLQPIYNAIVVLLAVFIIDMIVGILTDSWVNKHRLSKKKFMFALLSFAIYTTIISTVYVIGEKMGDLEEVLFVDKWLTYAVIYFYAANILKNLRNLVPQSRVIAFFDFVVGLEFMKRIPAIGEFLKFEKEVRETKENKEAE